MIHIVTQENRPRYRPAILEMHRHRKEVFIDEMGWELFSHDGYEIDGYDTPHAIYLITCAQSFSPVFASARLLPTTGPHLLGDVFGHLCEGGPPRSDRIWEASRFCPAPQTPKGEPRRALLGGVIAGILETGLLFGVEEVVFVASAALAPIAIHIGWDARMLGEMQRHGKERVCAMAASITPEGLAKVRDRLNLPSPVTRFAAGLHAND